MKALGGYFDTYLHCELIGPISSLSHHVSYSINCPNSVLEAWSLKRSNLPLQFEFPSRSLWGEARGDKISISMKALEIGKLQIILQNFLEILICRFPKQTMTACCLIGYFFINIGLIVNYSTNALRALA